MLLLSYFLYLLYTVNQFSFTHFRSCVSTFSYKHMPQCKFSLYLKKAGLASRNIVHFLKKVILRCIGLCFNYHHLYLLSRLDQPLIQRIPAGLSSTVACLDISLLTSETNRAKTKSSCSSDISSIFSFICGSLLQLCLSTASFLAHLHCSKTFTTHAHFRRLESETQLSSYFSHSKDVMGF